jgi:hypothetical protein
MRCTNALEECHTKLISVSDALEARHKELISASKAFVSRHNVFMALFDGLFRTISLTSIAPKDAKIAFASI